MENRYDDIIALPHHVSQSRPHMPTAERAAQFAPFAALTGYEEAVRETARLTREKPELDEDEIALLNDKLTALAARLQEEPLVEITYFLPDGRKAGGACVTATGRVKKIDCQRRVILLTEGLKIPIENIVRLEREEG